MLFLTTLAHGFGHHRGKAEFGISSHGFEPLLDGVHQPPTLPALMTSAPKMEVTTMIITRANIHAHSSLCLALHSPKNPMSQMSKLRHKSQAIFSLKLQPASCSSAKAQMDDAHSTGALESIMVDRHTAGDVQG